jgi:hypothetical protein
MFIPIVDGNHGLIPRPDVNQKSGEEGGGGGGGGGEKL